MDHVSAAGDDGQVGTGRDDGEESDGAELSMCSLPFHSIALEIMIPFRSIEKGLAFGCVQLLQG